MLGWACSNEKARGKTSREKQDAAKVMLMMAAPSPNKSAKAPSIWKRARLLGVPESTCCRVKKSVMDKRARLMAEEKEVYWARCQRKKGYRKITDNLCLLLIAAFYDHPHVIVLPNSKDTVMVKNDVGVKVPI
jgi:hypothetical protein